MLECQYAPSTDLALGSFRSHKKYMKSHLFSLGPDKHVVLLISLLAILVARNLWNFYFNGNDSGSPMRFLQICLLNHNKLLFHVYFCYWFYKFIFRLNLIFMFLGSPNLWQFLPVSIFNIIHQKFISKNFFSRENSPFTLRPTPNLSVQSLAWQQINTQSFSPALS